MTREELIAKIQDIEWDDFEAKEALNELPKNMWDTVSAFSNTSGGWVLCGVAQKGKKFEILGVKNGEKIENDFLTTLRNKDKFNHIIQCRPDKITVDGKLVLAFLTLAMIHPTCLHLCTKLLSKARKGDAIHPEKSALFTIY